MPCACPLTDNNFSPTCFLDDQDDTQTCDSCAPGYAGRNCETCMEGYFGNPLVSMRFIDNIQEYLVSIQ